MTVLGDMVSIQEFCSNIYLNPYVFDSMINLIIVFKDEFHTQDTIYSLPDNAGNANEHGQF